MVSFTKSKCPQFCFSYSVNSCSLIGVLSIFDIGVDRISELPPQLDKRTAATAENKKASINIIIVIIKLKREASNMFS